jgi:ABC-type phosphate transport system substrate-binding protein
MRAPHRPRPKRATFAAFIALGLLLAAVPLTFGSVPDGAQLPEAAAQAPRSVTVTPAAALAGEKVTVRWSGFTPGLPVSIFQCRTDPLVSWNSSCAEPTWTGGVTGLDGTGQAEFLVWQYTLQGLGANPALFCGESGCGVVVTECDTELAPGQFATAPLGVPFGGTNPVDGGDEELEPVSLPEPPVPATPEVRLGAAETGGRTLNVQAGQALDPVLPELSEAVVKEDIDLNSTVLNSPSAVEAYLTGRADIALTARPLSAEQQAQLEKEGRPSVMVPVALSPQVVAHNMDVRGVPIQRFRLSVDSMAKLYRGLIVGVDSPDLRRDNSGCGISASGRTTDRSILGYFRTGRSAANYTFSKWLATAGKDDAGAALWPPAQEPPVVAPSEQFPNAAVGLSRTNNRDLAEFIQLGSEPGATPQITNDAGRLRVGFVDMSAVVELVEESPAPAKPGLFPIRTVDVQNASGNWVAPNPISVTLTIDQSSIGADNVVDVNVRAAAPSSYPLVSVIYAVVPTAPSGTYDTTKAAAGQDLVAFLLSKEGQSILEEAGFVGLSGEIAQTAEKASATISAGEAPAPTTTAPPADEFVLGGSDFSGGGFDSDFDSFGEDSFSDGTGDFSEDATGAGADDSASGEEATGNSTIETSASLLERAAGAPALMAVLLLGVVALLAGQGLKRADRRRRAGGTT